MNPGFGGWRQSDSDAPAFDADVQWARCPMNPGFGDWRQSDSDAPAFDADVQWGERRTTLRDPK